MTTLLTPYLSTIKLLLAGFVSAAILSLGVSTWYYKSKYEGQIEITATTNVKLEQATISLETCSNKVTELGEETKKKLSEAEDAVKKAQAEARAYRNRADNLLAAKPITDDMCESASALLRDYVIQAGGDK